MTKYAPFEHQKIWYARKDTTEYISVLLNPECQHHLIASKKENRVCLTGSICYRNCCGTEQSIHHIYTNFLNCKLHMENISRWYLGFSEHTKFFPPNDCYKSEKYAMFLTKKRNKNNIDGRHTSNAIFRAVASTCCLHKSSK